MVSVLQLLVIGLVWLLLSLGRYQINKRVLVCVRLIVLRHIFLWQMLPVSHHILGLWLSHGLIILPVNALQLVIGKVLTVKWHVRGEVWVL